MNSKVMIIARMKKNKI